MQKLLVKTFDISTRQAAIMFQRLRSDILNTVDEEELFMQLVCMALLLYEFDSPFFIGETKEENEVEEAANMALSDLISGEVEFEKINFEFIEEKVKYAKEREKFLDKLGKANESHEALLWGAINNT